MEDGLDTRELEQYTKALMDLAQGMMPRESKKFMREEGKKLRKRTLALARERVKKGKRHKGGENTRYHKNIKAGKVYTYKGNGGLAIRVHSSRAPHAHLIEDGHVIKDRNGKELGFAPGKHVFGDALKGFAPEFYSDIDAFLDGLFE